MTREKKPNNYNIRFYSICDNAVSHETIYLQKYFMKKFINHLDGVITMSGHVKDQIIRLAEKDIGDNAGGGLKEFIRLSGSNPEMWKDIFELNVFCK